MALTTQIKNELAKLGIKPKKSLGQNFLINEGIYHKIITAAEIKNGDRVVEIGPGLGTLTKYLLDAGAEIIAIEKDCQLAEYLKTKFADEKRVKIIEGDVLKFDYTKYEILNTKYKVIGNIPYYLTSHLLQIIFEKWPTPERVVLMIQKEVAQRIAVKPPKMNMLAVLVQYYARPKIINHVSRNNFWPAPEVDSAIIRLAPRLQVTDYRLQKKGENKELETRPLKPEIFFRIAGAGFMSKRKQLGNNLARGLKLSKNFVEEKLKSVGIDPIRRAETLTLDEWGKIVNTFYSQD